MIFSSHLSSLLLAGAVRRVLVKGVFSDTELIEEIGAETFAPYQLVYRVTNGGFGMQHIGVVRVLPSPNGALFSWKVWASYEVPMVWTASQWLVAASLRRSQEKMIQLATKAAAAPAVPAPAPAASK